MTQNEECGGTYIGVSECTRREEYDGIGGGSKWGVSIYDGVGSPLNPFTDRMILLSTLYLLQDYRDEKIYYDVDTNTIGVTDEKLKEKLNNKLEKEKKIAERVRKINEVFGCGYDDDSDSDYDSDYEDCYDGFTWDEEGNIYLDF